MPTTVNGIGTHYYGKRDVSSRMGACQHCGAQGKLESYTTRLFFVILFIPIIPLKRVRLLDYCPHCSRHWIINPEQYEMSRQLAVSGALEKFRDTPSVENALIAHAQMLSFHMHTESDQFRATSLEQFADSADLRLGLASHLDQTGRWVEATDLYEAAFQRNPNLPEVRNSLAWRRINENKLDEAYELLDFMRQPGAGQSFNLSQLENLAKSYQKAGNHERTLEICEHLLREAPAHADLHDFRKIVSKSERALNRSSSLLPQKSFSIRGLFDSKSGQHAPWVRWAVFGGIASLLFAFGMSWLNEHRRSNRTLYLVSGFAQPVRVSVDGGPALTVTSRTPVNLAEGTHQISITDPFKKSEQITLQTTYLSRWSYSPIWVFNIEQTVGLMEETLHYAVNPKPSQRKWLLNGELQYIPHVDYVFETPPQSLEVKGSSTITKMRVGTVVIPTTSNYASLRQAADKAPAWAFAEGHLNQNPNDSSLLRLYANYSMTDDDQRRITEFLTAGLWKKPISVPWHREYQNLKSVQANPAPLIAEYDAQLAAEPNDAALLYLRGRISPLRVDQRRYFQLAFEKDPQSGWPAMALSYDAANHGKWQEAKDWSEKAIGKLRNEQAFRHLWHAVRMAMHDFAPMEAEYRQLLQSIDLVDRMMGQLFLIDVLAAQNRGDELRMLARQWNAEDGGESSLAESVTNQMIDYACGDVKRVPQGAGAAESNQQSRTNFNYLVASGDLDAALKSANERGETKEWLVALSLSVAYALAGNPTEADQWRQKAVELMKVDNDSDQKRGAAMLERDQSPTPEELDDVGLQLNGTPLFVAALAQRFPDRKQELLARAELLNVTRQPPYLLVKQVIDAK